MRKYEHVLLVRVSSDEQRENQTIESQLSDALKALAARGVVPDKIYRDDGVSGTIPLAERDEGRYLWRDVTTGEVGTVHIWKMDRIGRNLRDFLNLYHVFENYGTRLDIITQPLPEGPAGRWMMQMLGAGAEMDRANILENTRRGMVAKAERGGWTGGPTTFGYRVEGEKGANGKRRDGKLVIDEDDDAVIRNIYEHAATGKSSPVIAKYLNSSGARRSDTTSEWSKEAVREIIRNPMYKGVWQWRKRQRGKKEEERQPVIERECPKIVDADLWQRSIDMLASHRLVETAHAKNDYLLRGLIKCGLCKGRTYAGRGYAYACGGRADASCNAPIIYRKQLEDEVWDACQTYIYNPDEALKQLELEMASAAAPERNLPDEIRKAEARLASNKTARERVRLHDEEGYFSDRKEFHARMMKLTEQRDAIQTELAELRQRTEGCESQTRQREGARTMLEQLRHNVDAAAFTFEQKREIVGKLVETIKIRPLPANAEAMGMEYSDQIEIKFRFDLGNAITRGMMERFPLGPHRELVPEPDDDGNALAKGLATAYSATVAPASTVSRMCQTNRGGLRCTCSRIRGRAASGRPRPKAGRSPCGTPRAVNCSTAPGTA